MQVVSLDRRFLDPRRPQEEPTKTEKEEKLMQYQPYLPVVPTQIISYHKVRKNRGAWCSLGLPNAYTCGVV